MKLNLGLTQDNCNGRLRSEDMSELVKITVNVDGDSLDYYFKVPGLWSNVIIDYYELVKAAHPGAEITWQIEND